MGADVSPPTSAQGTSIPRGVRNLKSRNCYFPRFEGEIFHFLINDCLVCWKEQFYELPFLGIPNTGKMKLIQQSHVNKLLRLLKKVSSTGSASSAVCSSAN